MKTYDELKKLFETANKKFIKDDIDLFNSLASERALCGALMLHLNKQMMINHKYDGYYSDVEYNRNRGNIKTIVKTIMGPEMKIIKVTCDLIIHSRGKHPEQDNLIAIEMKKSTRPLAEKIKDKDRLKALTKDTYDDVWSYDGVTLPEHVCGYAIGIYYEINYQTAQIYLEYYQRGECVDIKIMSFK